MDPAAEATVLVLAGMAMGFINNLAGAGGLIGLAALDLASGLGASTVANATLRPAAVGVTVAGVCAFASKGRQIPAQAWIWGLASAPGAAAGAFLAVSLPEWVYRTTLVVVVVAMLVQQLRPTPSIADAPTTARAGRSATATFALFTLVGLHMGFLQVAVGLVTMLALGYAVGRDLVQVNAAKVAVLTVASTTSVACLATTGTIAWGPALWLAGGAAIGSFAGGRWSVRKGHGAVRVVVLLVCALMLVRVLIAS